MIPKNRLGSQLLTKLKVFQGPKHPHAAQKARTAQSRRLDSRTPNAQPSTDRWLNQNPEYLGTGRARTPSRASGSRPQWQNHRQRLASLKVIFPLENAALTATMPLTVTGTMEKFNARINVSGGGPNGPGRRRCGTAIARALLAIRRDPAGRVEGRGPAHARFAHEERKKYGQPGARKRFQYRSVNRTGNFQAPWFQSGGFLFGWRVLGEWEGCKIPLSITHYSNN